jgi:hypothetical protein
VGYTPEMKFLIVFWLYASSALSGPIYSVTSFTIPGSLVNLNKINDAGQIAGDMFPASGGGSVSGFVLSASGIITALPLPAGNVQAYGINDLGEVTGFATGPGFIYYPNGTSTLFSPPGNFETVGEGVNDAGDVVGSVEDPGNGVTHGFIRTPDGTLTLFDVPNGINATQATGINNSGEITGSNTDSALVQHGFAMEADGADFMSFDACSYRSDQIGGTFAEAINNLGEVAGECDSQSGTVGFIREPDGTISTYGFDPNPLFDNITNTAFEGINDEDVVTGNYDQNGKFTAFIATPSPEPATFVSSLIALSAILSIMLWRLSVTNLWTKAERCLN